jgi:hypothetical protein
MNTGDRSPLKGALLFLVITALIFMQREGGQDDITIT